MSGENMGGAHPVGPGPFRGTRLQRRIARRIANFRSNQKSAERVAKDILAMTDELKDDILISPDQAFRLMALSMMLREGDLSFRGYEKENETQARALIVDIGQEIALQMGGGA